MAASRGSNGFLSVDGNDISTYIRSSGLDASLDVIDVSTWGEDAKKFITGLEDGSFSLDGVWDETVDAHMQGMKGVIKPFVYGPNGSEAGKIKYSGNVILTSFNISNDVNSEIRFSGNLQVTGGVTRGTFA